MSLASTIDRTEDVGGARPVSGPRQVTRKLRVLQTIGSMHIGGAENVVVELARGLDRDRFDVEVCCTKQLGVLAEQLMADPLPVTLAAASSRRLRHLTSMYVHRVIRRFRPDVVHTHATPSLLHVAPLAALGLSPRWIHTFHYGNYATAQGRQVELERMFCRLASGLVAVSEAQRRTIVERYRLDPSRIATITNGVRFTPSRPEEVAARRRALGIAPDETVVGCVAVLSEQKGISYLLQAARLLAERHARVRFLIVGGGPLEGRLRAEAEALGLNSRVMFTGWRTDAQQLLPVLDVFVMSSLWEAMPMALVEAMAAGRPIVVTDVGDNRAIVGNGDCGLVVPPRDSAAIAGAVQILLDRAERRHALGDRATARFLNHDTTSHLVAAHEQLYEQP